MYQPERVLSLRQDLKSFKKPGFDTFADYYHLSESRHVKLKNLMNWNWSSLFSKRDPTVFDYNLISKLANQHINEFWKPYNLSLEFEIEHKEKHTALLLATVGKAHYGIVPISGDRLYKIRGVREWLDGKRHPMFDLLDLILDEKEVFNNLNFKSSNILSIKGWIHRHRHEKTSDCRPGDTVYTEEKKLQLTPGFLPRSTRRGNDQINKVIKNPAKNISYKEGEGSFNFHSVNQQIIEEYYKKPLRKSLKKKRDKLNQEKRKKCSICQIAQKGRVRTA